MEDNKEKETKFFNNRPALYQQLGRNLKGFGLERNGRKDDAIRLYEENLKENFEGTYPYDRLARIYREKNRVDDEIRVLEKAVWILKNIVFAGPNS